MSNSPKLTQTSSKLGSCNIQPFREYIEKKRQDLFVEFCVGKYLIELGKKRCFVKEVMNVYEPICSEDSVSFIMPTNALD